MSLYIKKQNDCLCKHFDKTYQFFLFNSRLSNFSLKIETINVVKYIAMLGANILTINVNKPINILDKDIPFLL